MPLPQCFVQSDPVSIHALCSSFSPLLTLAPSLVKEHKGLLNSKFWFLHVSAWMLFLPSPLLSYLPTSTRVLLRCRLLQHSLSEINTFSKPSKDK